MGILREELERMARIATHRHFTLALILFSSFLGLVSRSGLMLMCFVGIFLELVGWAFSLWVTASMSFLRVYRGKDAIIMEGGQEGMRRMLETNFPRQLFGHLGEWLSVFLGYQTLYGGVPPEMLGLFAQVTLGAAVSFFVLNLFLGFIIGTFAGVYAKGRAAKSIMKGEKK